MNDPNDLIYHERTYYIYMQNTPYSDDHKNKSWLLYTTKDFINYVYEGIVLTPLCEFNKHGVFSGGAFVNENNEIDLYYTGNIKDENNKRMSNTLIENVDFKNKKVNKKLLFQTDLSLYTGEFRDPNIVKKGENIFMLNGAQNNDKKGVLSIYKKENNLWKYFKDIKLDLGCEQNRFMVECTNYFKIDNREFILSC
nr:hypothetical protein [Mesoplasma melaleucae]